jgi:acetyl esterase/lipase
MDKYKPLILLFFLVLHGCAFKSVTRTKEITYLNANPELGLPEKQLNVFAPRKEQNAPVLIFIHGGSWESGNKEIYDFLGGRLARRSVVAVIIDYPLAPDYQVPAMEKAVVQAVNWTKKNIQTYGGNPEEIYVSGHSAGGHLAGLLATKEIYFEDSASANPLKGAILIDPAGLDMYWFLQETVKTGDGRKYLKSFTDDPEVWKDTSPIYFLDKNDIPIIIMEGERTYPGIRLTVDRFRREAEQKGIPLDYSFYKKKKHIPMITQFFWTGSRGYDDLFEFIQKTSLGSGKNSTTLAADPGSEGK